MARRKKSGPTPAVLPDTTSTSTGENSEPNATPEKKRSVNHSICAACSTARGPDSVYTVVLKRKPGGGIACWPRPLCRACALRIGAGDD